MDTRNLQDRFVRLHSGQVGTIWQSSHNGKLTLSGGFWRIDVTRDQIETVENPRFRLEPPKTVKDPFLVLLTKESFYDNFEFILNNSIQPQDGSSFASSSMDKEGRVLYLFEMRDSARVIELLEKAVDLGATALDTLGE